MSINYEDLGQRLAVAVRESPGFGIEDLELQKQYRIANSTRIWEIWTQCKMFDPRDRQVNFSQYSGLPTGVVNRYMEVCRKYEEDRATERIAQSRKTTSKKSKQISQVS